jgi:hypothetical protein
VNKVISTGTASRFKVEIQNDWKQKPLSSRHASRCTCLSHVTYASRNSAIYDGRLRTPSVTLNDGTTEKQGTSLPRLWKPLRSPRRAHIYRLWSPFQVAHLRRFLKLIAVNPNVVYHQIERREGRLLSLHHIQIAPLRLSLPSCLDTLLPLSRRSLEFPRNRSLRFARSLGRD